jgi:opacity protein-like surface antigen
MKKNNIWLSLTCLAVSALPGAAQIRDNLTFHVGGGFTEPVGNTDGRLKVGFNALGGVGFNFTPNFGVVAEFGFNGASLTPRALNDAGGIPDGSVRIYSVTLNPKVRFNLSQRFGVYAVGGGGFYRRTVEFTEPTVSVITAFDPFYGVFFPAVVPTNAVLGSFTQNKAGVNVGGGLEVGLGQDAKTKVFAETRYHYLYTTPVRTMILPVTFGVRW